MIGDTDPHHLATVMGTVDEGLKMQELGMGADEIVEAIKGSLKTKHASGGRVSLSSGGLAGMLGE